MKLVPVSIVAVVFLSAFLILSAAAADAQKPVGDETMVRLAKELSESAARLKANPESPDAAHAAAGRMSELAGYLARRGQAGDSEKALSYFNGSLELREQLLKSLPREPRVVRGVSLALNELGEFLSRRGQPSDAEKALASFTRSLELAEGLYKARPDSPEAARDLGVSLDRLGSFLVRRNGEGDAEKAEGYFTRSLEMSEAFSKANPDSADGKKDLALALERMGSFLAARGGEGDVDKVLEQYKRSMELREGLSKAAPDSADAAREFSVSLEKLGDLLARHGKPGDAEKTLLLFAQSVVIREEIMKAHPTSAQAARDLSVGLNKLGDLLASMGRPGDEQKALEHFTRDLEISEKLMKANPESVQAARDVVVSRYKLAGIAQRRGDSAEEEKQAKACYDVLHSRITAGVTFDAPMMEFYETLKLKFGEK